MWNNYIIVKCDYYANKKATTQIKNAQHKQKSHNANKKKSTTQIKKYIYKKVKTY